MKAAQQRRGRGAREAADARARSIRATLIERAHANPSAVSASYSGWPDEVRAGREAMEPRRRCVTDSPQTGNSEQVVRDCCCGGEQR